jgi:hypothetical protein
MLIKTKYIDCASKSVFNTWKLPTSAADTSGDIYWSAIVYIQDTGEVWTHGKLYGGFFSNADSNKVSLTIGGTTKILALDGHVQSYTTLTGSGTTADQAILSTGVANKWTLKTLGKNAFSNVDYLPADATAVAAEKVVNAMRFQYNGKDMHSFDGSVARLLNIIQGDNVFITGDSQGNVTIAADPGSDTVNTAGATNLIDKKLFLIGAESQTTSPQTYSNQYVYIGTDNCLYSLGKKVLTEHQAIYNLDLQTQVGDAVTKVTTFDPNAANNSFTLVQGTNVTLIPDATNKKVTISSKDTTYDFYNLIFKQGDTVVDTYKPTTSPNKSFKAGTNVTFTKSGDEITVTTQDTRNTAGATEKLATKLFLTGSLTQTDNPQTYTNSKVYIGTDNKLYSDGKVVSTGDHTHNYAGATTPGGPALKVDLNPSGLLDATYGSYGGILQDSNNGPATGSWSNRIKILHNNSSGYYTELAQAMTGTAGLWHRRNVAGVVSDWTPVIDKANFRTYLDATYVIRGNDPNVLTNYVRYSIASGLTMNWEAGNATPTHVWGAKNGDSSKAYVFNGDNIRAFANAVNRAGDTMTGTLKVTEIQATNGNGLVMWNGTTYTYLGMQAGTTYIRSGATDLQHRYNGTDYKIWDARNLVGLRTEHSHNTINFIDSRSTASTPQEHGAGVWLDFKSNSSANLNDGGSYTGLLTVRKYGGTTDWTGGKSAQLGFTDNSNLWVRFGSGTAWEAWKQIATTGWADGKFLPLAGGTMTGSITISTDSVLQWSRNTDYAKIHFKNTGDADADSYLGFETGDNGNEYFKFSGRNGSTVTQWMSIKSGGVTAPAFIKSGSSDNYVLLGAGGHKALDLFIQVDRGSSINNRDNKGTNQAWFDYNFGGSGIVGSAISFTGLSNYATQLCAGYSDANAIGIRTYNGDKQTWNPVKRLWHNGNLTPGNYVLKAGDTMTGKLNWSMNGVASSIGSDNGSYTHYNTNASSGHWFNKNVYSAGNFYGGSSYNRILPFKDEINSQVGGSKSAQMLWNSWSTDAAYGGAIQIREYGNVTNSQSAWSYSPAISFHWGNRYAKRFGMRSDGQFAVDDVPISLSTHNHNSLYVTALGTNGNYLTWTKNGTVNNITVPYSSNSDKLDGVHNGDVTANYYKVNGQQTLNLSSLNANTWYPCVMTTHPSNTTPIRVTFTDALSGHKPSWSTHSSGFSFQFDFEWIGGGWGTIDWYLRVYRYAASFGGETACYGLEQRNNRSALVLYMRGGTSYYYRTTDGRSFTVYSSTTNIGDSTYPDNVSPRTSKLNDCYRQEASSRYGTCYWATNADNVTNADTVDGQHASAFSYKSWWHWSDQGGQPTWLWGGNSENNYYVYNPSNFNVNSATYAHKVRGEYTGNGGQQNPNYFGVNWVGFRMMNTTIGTNSQYKDWIISDCYSGNDVGGAVAFGMNRQSLGAYLMGSDAARTSWTRKGTFWGDWNLDPVDKTLLHKSRVPGEMVDFYVYKVGSYTCTSTDYTTFKNQLFDSSGRGKSSVTYQPTYASSKTYTVNLSDFILAYNGISAYSNGMYTAGGGEIESNRIGSTAGANSKTISGLEMPKHAHWFGHYRSDNANDRDVFGPDGNQNWSTNGTNTAGQGGNWRTGYSGSGSAKDWRPKTIFVFKMIYAPQSW